MKILVFTEGTILTNERWLRIPRDEVVRQIKSWATLSEEELERLRKKGDAPSVRFFARYVPIGNCVQKIRAWKRQGATIKYLTSRRTPEEIEVIRNILREHRFPEGELLSRQEGEEYKDVAERVMPDILVEDDCESIGGEEEMTYSHIRPALKAKVKSVVVREGGGIDHLPNDLAALSSY
jgi:hypothetical protein